MIKVCKICKKEFEAKRVNASLCSDECKREARRRYAETYRLANPEKVRERQRKWWHDNRAINPEIKGSDNLDITIESDPKPKKKKKAKKAPLPKYTGSKWAKIYTKADRLTKISMLSGALSQHEIAHLSYGKLSTMWCTDKYNSLLQQVIKIKQQEEHK